jgi:antitoxin MazE
MRTIIRKIGNSKGIVLPKKVLDQYHLGSEVELVTAKNHIEIHPVASKRADWEDRFKAANAEQDEEKLLGDFTNDFDREGWTW